MGTLLFLWLLTLSRLVVSQSPSLTPSVEPSSTSLTPTLTPTLSPTYICDKDEDQNPVLSVTSGKEATYGSLSDDSKLYSQNCEYSFGIRKSRGYVRLTYETSETILWRSKPFHYEVSEKTSPYELQVTPSGNLRLMDGSSDIIWETDTSNVESSVRPYNLSVSVDGNVVLSDSNNLTIWQLYCKGKANYFSSGIELDANYSIKSINNTNGTISEYDDVLYSPSCEYGFKVTHDGSLELRRYNNGTDEYSIVWKGKRENGTNDSPPYAVYIDSFGTLNTVDADGNIVWSATLKFQSSNFYKDDVEEPFLFIVRDEGKIIIQDANDVDIWKTGIKRRPTEPNSSLLEYSVIIIGGFVFILLLFSILFQATYGTKMIKYYAVDDVIGVKHTKEKMGVNVEEQLLIGRINEASLHVKTITEFLDLDPNEFLSDTNNNEEEEYEDSSELGTDDEEWSDNDNNNTSGNSNSSSDSNENKENNDTNTNTNNVNLKAILYASSDNVKRNTDTTELYGKRDIKQTKNNEFEQVLTEQVLMQSAVSLFEWGSRNHWKRYGQVLSDFSTLVWISILHILSSVVSLGVAIRWGKAVYGVNQWTPSGVSNYEMRVFLWLLLVYIFIYHICSSLTLMRDYKYTFYNLGRKRNLELHETRVVQFAFLEQLLDIRIYRELYNSVIIQQPSKFFYDIFKMKYTISAGPLAVLYLYYLLRVQNFSVSWLVAVGLGLQICIFLTRNILFDDEVFTVEASRKWPPSCKFLTRIFFRMCELSYRLILFALLPYLIHWSAIAVLVPVYIIGNTILFSAALLGKDPWNILYYIMMTPDMGLVSRPRDLDEWIDPCIATVLVPTVKLVQCFFVPYLGDSYFGCTNHDDQVLFDLFVARFIESQFLLWICGGIQGKSFFVSTNSVGYYLFWISLFGSILTIQLFFIMRRNNFFDSNRSIHRNPLQLAKEGRWRMVLNVIPQFSPDDLDMRDSLGQHETVMILAAKDGKYDIVQKLIDRGSSVNRGDRYGETPLHKVAKNGRVEILELLLKNGADVNQPNLFGWNSLHKAAYHGNKKCCEILLDNNCDVLAIMGENYTCIGCAMLYGNLDIVQLMLKQANIVGLSINQIKRAISYVQKNKKHGGPLTYAVAEGEIEMAWILLTCRVQNINGVDHLGEAAIHKAAREGYYKLCRALIYKYKCDINLNNDSELNAFHVAAYHQHSKIVNLLLKERCNISVPTIDYANCVLLGAASQGHLNIVKLMLRLGADVDYRDNNGYSSLQLAASQNFIEIAKTLLDVGADKIIRDCNGYTVLDYQLTQDMRLLIEDGILPDKMKQQIENENLESIALNIIVDDNDNDGNIYLNGNNEKEYKNTNKTKSKKRKKRNKKNKKSKSKKRKKNRKIRIKKQKLSSAGPKTKYRGKGKTNN